MFMWDGDRKFCHKGDIHSLAHLGIALRIPVRM
jgi:hypothetical protein